MPVPFAFTTSTDFTNRSKCLCAWHLSTYIHTAALTALRGSTRVTLLLRPSRRS